MHTEEEKDEPAFVERFIETAKKVLTPDTDEKSTVSEAYALDIDLENRFKWHTPVKQATGLAHNGVRSNCLVLAYFIKATVPPGREQALALTKLEEVMMRANSGIARN